MNKPRLPRCPYRLALAATAAGAALLAGCTLAPTYERPAAPVAANYPLAGNAQAAGDQAAAKLPWQTFFNDARLRALITLALDNNRDLRIAALNIDQAQAQYRIARADLLPTINGSASFASQRLPGDVSLTGQTLFLRQYTAGLAVTSYEADLFGRVRSASNAAMSTYLATDAAQKAVRVSLIAEVAKAAVTQQALAEQLALAQRTLAAREKTLALTRQRFEIGAASALDVRQAETLFYQSKGDVASATRALAQADNALTLLIGAPLPADLPAPASLEALHMHDDIPAGLPSELLVSRPDIIQAEYALQAANANIGAARAAFLPRILLTGLDGVASAAIGRLFSGPQLAWSWAPSITMPIFDFGRTSANLDVAKVRKNVAVAQYEKAIQTAFREVADALAGRATLDTQLDAADKQAQAEAARHQLVEQRARNGIASGIEQLDAERAEYAAQQSLLQVRASRLLNRVDLYKALGGGTV